MDAQSPEMAAKIPESEATTDSDGPQQLSFVYKAIDDCQAIIRHLDTKAALALIPLGFVLNKLIGELDHYFSGLNAETVVALLIVSCSLICIAYVFSMLYPR